MKLCLVYNPNDNKLHPNAYCSIFKDMFIAVGRHPDCTQFVTKDCSAEDIEADIIFFFDPHATHHIQIDGIENHPAVKMEYWNDMHQEEQQGKYATTGVVFHKLGKEQRVRRAEYRGVKYIVAGVRDIFHEVFSKYWDTEKMLRFFPHAPEATNITAFVDKKKAVLGNGATWGAWRDGYGFRKWAFSQPYIEHIQHYIVDKSTPMGADYKKFLAGYAGALALSSIFPVPKYIKIPAAGCVTFAEYHKEYEDLGFKDYITCIYVNKKNFKERVGNFLEYPGNHMGIAEAGRQLVENNYTANHFADFILRGGE